jgi:hypothetical protein
MFGLVELGLIYFSLAKLRLHTENQLCIMLRSALKVCVGGGGWWWVVVGGGGWVLKVNLVITLA